MVDAVRIAGLALLKVDLEILGDAAGRVEIAVQAQEAWVEGRHILGERFARVALRVDSHEKKLHAVAVGAQLLHHLRHLGERGRAHIGAMGEAEKHHHCLAAEIFQMARLAVVIGEIDRFAVVRAGDVGALELRAAVAACG